MVAHLTATKRLARACVVWKGCWRFLNLISSKLSYGSHVPTLPRGALVKSKKEPFVVKIEKVDPKSVLKTKTLF
jgi:hypothetical protein